MSKKHNGLLWRVLNMGYLSGNCFLCTWCNRNKKSRCASRHDV